MRVRHSLVRHTLAAASTRMNPNRHRAAQIRAKALKDQIAGLERWVAAGRTEPHVVDRLAQTRAELAHLEALPARQSPGVFLATVWPQTSVLSRQPA